MHLAPSVDRRSFVGGGLTALAALLTDSGVNLRAQTPPVRREVHDPAAAPMLQLYKRAIKQMKDLPSWDPRSWWFQANIHWTPFQDDTRGCYELNCFNALFQPPAGATPDVLARIEASKRLVAGQVEIDPRLGVGRDRIWLKCPHHTYDFLPWHRVYLFFFERTIESVVGEPFALPYWNYLDQRFRDFPPPFRPEREADGSDNPLFYPDRNPLCRDPNDPNVPASEKPLIRESDLNWQTSADQRFFERGDVLQLDRGFAFQMESAPHDQVHVRIGVVTANNVSLGMATPALAARDPIFYLHHSNLDRVWEWWRTQPLVADTDPPRTPDYIWTQEPYLFVSPTIQKVGLTANEAIGMVGTAYNYDQLDPVPALTGGAQIAQAPLPASRVGRSNGVKVAPGAPATTQLAPEPGAGAAIASATARWFLRLSGVYAPAAKSGAFDVYLDPPGTGPVSARPAGGFALFAASDDRIGHAGHAGHATGTDKVVEVTARMRELIAQGIDPSSARITVRPTSTSGAAVNIERIELFSR